MPPCIEYTPSSQSNDYQALEDAFSKEYNERAKRFKRAWSYYDGDLPNPLVLEKDGVNDNVLLCKIDQIADKTVSFLLGDGIEFDSGGDGQHTVDDDNLDALWHSNRSELLLHNIALTGAIAGHCYVRLEPREAQMPRIVNLNPSHCSTFWSMENIDWPLWYRLQYTLDGANGMGKRIDYVRGSAFPGIEGGAGIGGDDVWWEIVYRRGNSMGYWTEQSRQQLAWPFPPIVEWQNLPRPHTAYGTDDVSKALELNDAINLIASDWNRTLKHHAHPKTIGLGFDGAAVQGTEIGGFWTVNKPKSEADIYNLEMKSDLTASQNLLDIITRELWGSARLVDPQTIKDAVGSLTNFGLRVMFADALRKTQTKRLLYGEALELISRRGLVMAGYAPPETVNIGWPDVLPEDNAEVATALLGELAAGVISLETYRSIRGYDPDLENERLQAEKAGKLSLGEAVLTAFSRGQSSGAGL